MNRPRVETQQAKVSPSGSGGLAPVNSRCSVPLPITWDLVLLNHFLKPLLKCVSTKWVNRLQGLRNQLRNQWFWQVHLWIIQYLYFYTVFHFFWFQFTFESLLPPFIELYTFGTFLGHKCEFLLQTWINTYLIHRGGKIHHCFHIESGVVGKDNSWAYAVSLMDVAIGLFSETPTIS